MKKVYIRVDDRNSVSFKKKGKIILETIIEVSTEEAWLLNNKACKRRA